jgi:hypothetical protein
MALWLLWHSVSSILGSGLGPLGMWFGLGTSSSSGCWSPIWVSLKSALPVILLDRLGGSDFTSSGIPGAKCREEWWRGPEKHSWAVLPIVQRRNACRAWMSVSTDHSTYYVKKPITTAVKHISPCSPWSHRYQAKLSVCLLSTTPPQRHSAEWRYRCKLITVAAQTKALDVASSNTGITGSSTTLGMDVYLFFCVCAGLQWAAPPIQDVLSTVCNCHNFRLI